MSGSDEGGKSVTLEKVLDKIRDSHQKTRSEGLKDLKNIFDPKYKANIDLLSDKSYHKVYEALFTVALSEKQSFLAAKKTTKATARGKLTTCSNIVRTVVKLGAPKLKRKTVEAVLEHITQTLPKANGDYCEPITHDYLQALVSVLDVKANVERLKRNIWLDIVDFCLQGVNRYVEYYDEDSSGLSHTFSAPRSSHLSAHSLASSSPRQDLEDLLQSLSSLISSPNAPVVEKAEDISRSVIRCLKSESSTVGPFHKLAFSIMNSVVNLARADRTSFSRSIAADSIPIFTRLWQGKALAKDEMLNTVRDQMLALLFATHLHLERSFRDEESPNLASKLEDLLEVLRADYSRRLGRDQIQLDDVEMTDLGTSSLNRSPFSLHVFALRPHRPFPERNWAHLQAIGILERLMSISDDKKKPLLDDDNTDRTEHPQKRQRITKRSDKLFEPLMSRDENVRMAGLQILPFVLQECHFPVPHLTDLIAHLVDCSTDKRGNIFSWALLAMASCNFQKNISEIKTVDWVQLWHIGARALTFSGTCRAAAAHLHAMLAKGLVQYQNVGEDINAMINAADITGPVVLCDSSALFMMHLLYVNMAETPGASLTTCNHLIRWFFGRWNPADKSFAGQLGGSIQPCYIMALLRTSLGLPRVSPSKPSLPWGPLAQTWQQHLVSQDIIRYLLLLESPSLDQTKRVCSACPRYVEADSVVYSQDTAHFHSARRMIFELLLPKFSDLLQAWKIYGEDQSSQVSLDVYRTGVYACILVFQFLPHFTDTKVPQYRALESDAKSLTNELLTYLQSSEERDVNSSQTMIETLLQSIQPYLPAVGATELTRLSQECPDLLQFFVSISGTLNQRRSALEAVAEGSPNDSMDVDDEFTTQRSHGAIDPRKIIIPRHELALEMSSVSFYLKASGRLLLIQAMSEAPEYAGLVPTAFIDQFISMKNEEVLSCRGLLQDIFRSDLVFEVENGERLLVHVGGILSSLDYERCEIAICMCLDVLDGLEHLWSTPDGSAIAEAALELYQWYVNVAVTKNVVSSAAQKGVAKLLFRLLRTQPDYGVAMGLPSPRTNLLEILQEGSHSVKFYIGDKVPDIFELFTLKTHDDVFVDVLESLPSDPKVIESIALRIFVLSKLASRWSTLLRRCIYHIFEVPGRIPNSLNYATRCLADVSSVLEVKGPQELFILFEPQLLYTWLEQEPIKDIPYQIFGFTSLTNLLSCAQEEAAALMLMRAQDEAFQRLAYHLKMTESQLIRNCFTKAVAYSIGHDLSTPPPPNNQKRVTGESRIKKRLGPDLFFEVMNLHFVDILATLFNLVDPEEEVENRFAKDESLVYAAEIMKTIKGMGCSDMILPPPQQPTFRVKYLPHEIRHLCMRMQHKPADMYTPAFVTSVARKLFNTIHPALGSLHACSVLRKLRILISLAGKSALKGYPLEMLLHAARPFIADSECTDDAIGIVHYLLVHGSSHLLQSPSFVAGIALSIMGSLRNFLKSSQASTTQDSQYRLTKSKAQKFHVWMGKFASEYTSPSLKRESASIFHSMLRSAHSIGSLGNAELDTSESRLLSQLLDDEKDEGSLLNDPSRKLAFAMLCSDFKCPPSFRMDIFGKDSEAIENSAVVWRSCKTDFVSTQYLTWAARILGRAFAASGQIHEELLQESTLKITKQSYMSADSDVNSKACILKLIQAMTLGDDRQAIGLAEGALRTIVSTADEHLLNICQTTLSYPLFSASLWKPYQVPPSETLSKPSSEIEDPFSANAILVTHWLRDLTLLLARSVPNDPVLGAIQPILQDVQGFADQAFPFILHAVLCQQTEVQRTNRKRLSAAFVKWFGDTGGTDKNKLKTLINSILYLRRQPLEQERSSADRWHWLDLDYSKAAGAATYCGMFKTALLFIEEFASTPSKTSRRSSAAKDVDRTEISTDALLAILENIDDPDMYYGVQQTASLSTILARVEHERDGSKSLAFRGAQYDSHIRRRKPEAMNDVQALVKALDVLSLSGLSRSLLQAQQTVGMSNDSLDSMFQTARKLEQWDIPVPNDYSNNSVTMYKAFQAIHTADDRVKVAQALNEGLERTMKTLVQEDLNASALRSSLQTLAALTELDEVLVTEGSEQFEEMLSRFQNRSEWMKSGRFEDVNQILSCRGTTLSTLSQQPRLQRVINIASTDTRLVEVQTALLSSTLSRAHNGLQESLSLATLLTDLIIPCREVGLSVEAAIHLEAANALWDQGEMSASIGILQSLDKGTDLKNQTIPIGRSDLLSKIGHQVSMARLEKSDRILERYLKPALKELKGKTLGSEAGEVFHQFAMFCYQQLQDTDNRDELERLSKQTQTKQNEVNDLERLKKNTSHAPDREKYAREQGKSKTWLKLDQQELRRQEAIRNEFMCQSLENYLLALSASDDHDNDALRFSALWLENSLEQLTNDTVSKHMNQVPSRKFAPLMSQLSSRLLDNNTRFQELLFSLVLRICTDHPYHSMYQIYTGVHNRPKKEDDIAMSRHKANLKVAEQLSTSSKTRSIWDFVKALSKAYCVLAVEKSDKIKSGRNISFKDSPAATRLQNLLPKFPIPPPTLQIPLAADLDYSNIPTMVKYEPQMSIASGVSAPRILTVFGSNGEQFKQLVKGGGDDLRQDAIMEQVFAQVSELLKSNRSTRQRNLRIRTYKVLPLASTAGIIEFVANTIPIHDYLIPAHERFYPKDIKAAQCRKEITDVQTSSQDVRVKKFRSVAERFHPVMRFYFTEKFHDPDEWFVKRLAYTRSTAAISMLGHVLGLGDRHGHNILLDSGSGEVVHIDLGIAFEMGRVLPVPELVPFRLTRDIVDGMGITKTKGVFRRCCEFTLEALRKEVYSIMTILDVLRYDPLYSWSISPIRLAKLQEAQSMAAPEAAPNASGEAVPSKEKTKEVVNQPSEADRALGVVNKKLSKTLSVTATVNDLINQASDERNLAVLYSGWAAYA